MVKKDLFCYAEREMKQLADIRKASTVRNYMTALNALAQYLGRRSLPLDDIDRQLMQDFERCSSIMASVETRRVPICAR